MNLKELLKNFPIFIGAVAVSVVFAFITLFKGNKLLAAVEFLTIIAFAAAVYFYGKILNARKEKMFSRFSGNFSVPGGNMSAECPLPIVVCKPDGKIKWFNKAFDAMVIGSHPSSLTELSATFNDMGLDSIVNSVNGVSIECGNKFFNVFSHNGNMGGESVIVMYFVDTTNSNRLAEEFIRTRPALLIFTIDNISEIQQDYRDSDCSAIRNGIEKLIETWLSGYPCFKTKVSDSKFYIVAEKQDVDNMIERKFDILDTVRKYTYDGKYVGVTLSIGVGNGSDMSECENNAKLSLDMALGRGGDQAVIKTKDNYEFFGGISKSVESSNKVKSRIVASALSELISGCDSIFIMGHIYPDFDAIGSALGVAFITKCFEKDAYIICDRDKSLASPLINRAVGEGFDEIFVSIEDAKKLMSQSKKNLLIVVDTHINKFVECEEILSMSNMTVVIDHHRKAVDYIKDSVIFFHDPSSSSTSEMVTELIEYIPEVGEPSNVVADGLMAGIMLDTKNFILRSSPRTFEAAAFLKSCEADTVRVKRLFANDIESWHLRNEIISGAKKYQNCIIAFTDSESANIKAISAQAADELLNISGVDASFVVFRFADKICVSARSLGAVNVQILMEQLGGGGHQTMAAAQVEGSDIEKVISDIMRSIDNLSKEKEDLYS